ncbi:NAD-dependent epimerase/dehydratase family protein [Aneurinibacillus uraniidurans]|uniref:NAD-dependent epimerase/dehydratase family protein n=1 Tax=Aneurinibacillus uraniidurans TaxID=2966586 RepID=UPI00234B46C3|nr:NAD(P)-dependent oxidoreductase [Aneurinibacillus sp. B1]WCN36560.1 NAD(P)-dependent oxidoreductase [Aneurinibacillus sp. B1]
MKIFVAGTTGVIGRFLIPLLVEEGHEVSGMIRDESHVNKIIKMGVKPVVADAFDRDAVFAALQKSQPDIVIHQLTSLSTGSSVDNARIRIEGTRNLVDAAKSVGVKRMIAQSISWAYEDGDIPAAEEVPLDIHAPMPRKTTIDGIAALEEKVTEMPESVILRYGTLYGPGTWYAIDGIVADQVRRKELVATNGVSSFLHVEDAARAALLALDWPSGLVNIVDDSPAPGTLWLPAYASAIGAAQPSIQAGRNRGERGASNNKARNKYGWEPIYPSWSEGFKNCL